MFSFFTLGTSVEHPVTAKQSEELLMKAEEIAAKLLESSSSDAWLLALHGDICASLYATKCEGKGVDAEVYRRKAIACFESLKDEEALPLNDMLKSGTMGDSLVGELNDRLRIRGYSIVSFLELRLFISRKQRKIENWNSELRNKQVSFL